MAQGLLPLFNSMRQKAPPPPAQGTAKTEQPAFLPPVLQCTRPHRRKSGGTGRKHLHSGNKKTGLKTGKICNIIGYCTVCTALHLPDSAPLSCGEEGDSFGPFGFETRQTVCRTACLRRNSPFMPGPAAWQPARNYSWNPHLCAWIHYIITRQHCQCFIRGQTHAEKRFLVRLT